MALAPVYRPLPSPLHATRAAISALWIAALALASLLLSNPIVLCSIATATLIAALAAGVGRQMRSALILALILGIPTVLINVLISRHGLTVFVRLGDLGPFGQGDLTIEALLYGMVIALQVGILILLSALATLSVDPDQLIALCSRLSFRSALTASIALRMVPLLASDAQRLAEAQRTRPACGGRRRRAAAMRDRALLIGATISGALDRSMDVAATLELRGLARAKPARAARKPLSRHDIAFLCSAAAVCALALVGSMIGIAGFDAYPLIKMQTGVATVALCAAIVASALLPLLDRRGIDP